MGIKYGLVNLADNGVDYGNWYSDEDITTYFSNGWEMNPLVDEYTEKYLPTNLKDNTTYTFIFNVVTNTYNKYFKIFENGDLGGASDILMSETEMLPGLKKVLINTGTIINNRMRIACLSNEVGGKTLKVEDIMLIEGDHTGSDLTYFEKQQDFKVNGISKVMLGVNQIWQKAVASYLTKDDVTLTNAVDNTGHYYFNGSDAFIQFSTVTLRTIVMDLEILTGTSSGDYLLDTRTGTGSGYIYGSGHGFEWNNNQWIDDVESTISDTLVYPRDQRFYLGLKSNGEITDDITLFARHNGTSQMKVNVYSVSVWNKELTLTEYQNYRDGNLTGNENGLVGWLDFR